MRKIFQQILLFLFFIFVVWLGIFAYKMASNTLVFAFQWQEKQEWDALILVVNRPWTLSKIIPSGVLLDQEAIRNSLLLNGENISSENFDFIFEESFVKIIPKNLKNDDILVLSADLYNQKKQTSYQLPSDIKIILSENNNKSFSITEVGISPKDKKFRIISEGIDVEKILWYVYYPHAEEKCFSGNSYWNYKNFSPLDVTSWELSDNPNEAIIALDIDVTKKKQCVIAGYADDIEVLLERELPDFALQYNLEKIVDEYGIVHDKINISSSSMILNQASNELELKKNIAKKIHFSPSVVISEGNISLTDEGFSIVWDFENNVKYRLYIEDLEDIYGRTASLKMNFMPQNNEFLGLQFSRDDAKFSTFEEIDFNIISTKKNQSDFELKICRLDVTGFSRVIEIANNPEKIHDFYGIIESSFASDCQKNSLHFSENNKVEKVKITDFFDKNVLRPGLYVLAFRNIDDFKNTTVGNFSLPFSVENLHIFGQNFEWNKTQLLISDNVWESLEKQQIEIFEEFLNEENKISYLTGIVLGETNNSGILETDLSSWNDKNIFLVARSSGQFGFFQGKNFTNFSQDFSDFEVTFSDDKNVFLKGEILDFVVLLQSKIKNISEENFVISLKNPSGKDIKKIDLKANFEGLLWFQYNFFDADELGEYEINIATQSGENISTKKIFLVSEIEKEDKIFLDFSLRNAENNIPKNLRERPNSDESKLYYEKEFFAPIEFEIIANFYDDRLEKIKNTPFEYSLFEYSLDQKNKKIIYEWSERFDNDGLGRVVLASEFQTLYHDKKYEIRLKTQDIKTGKIFEKSAELIVKIPEELKTFDDNLKLDFELKNEFISTGSMLDVSIISEIEDKKLSGKYFYEILDEAGGIIKNDIISSKNFSISHENFYPWLHAIRIIPITPEGIIAPNSLVVGKRFFITGTTENNFEKWEVFINKKSQNIYDLLIIVPKNIENIFVSYIKNGALITENLVLNGAVLRKTMDFSDSDNEKMVLYFFSHLLGKNSVFEKNISLAKNDFTPQWEFFHSENIFANNSEKIKFVPKTEKSSEIASISLSIFEENEHIFENEIKKQENIREILFFGEINSSQKEKWGTLYVEWKKYRKNIAFFPNIALDKNNEFIFDFSFKEGNKKYTLEAIYILKNGEIKKQQKEIFVQENFSLDWKIPQKTFPGDKISTEITLTNHTNTIVPLDLELTFLHSETPVVLAGSMILNLSQTEKQLFETKIPDSWLGEVPVSIVVKKNNEVVATGNQNITIEEIPSMGLGRQTLLWTATGSEIPFPNNPLYKDQKSFLEIRAATDLTVIIPGILEDIWNSKNISISEKIAKIHTEILLLKNEKTASLISPQIVADATQFFSEQDFDKWKENFSESDLLDMMRFSLEIEKNGIVLPASFSEKMKKYFRENILTVVFEKSQDIRAKILLVQTILHGDIDEKIIENIDKNELSVVWFLDFMESYVIGKRILSVELYDEFLSRFETFLIEWEWKIFRQTVLARYVRIWFASGKIDKANEILNRFFLISHSGISSISEKLEMILLALSHSKIVNQKDVTVKMVSEKISAEDTITKGKNIVFWQIPREKISEKIHISTKNNQPIFYEIREKNYLEAPSLFVEKESEFLKISQKIQKINEFAGVDENGNFCSVSDVLGNYLEKNSLYKVTISAEIKNFYNNLGTLSIWVYYPNNAKIFPIDRRLETFLWNSFSLNFSKISHQNSRTLLEKNMIYPDEKVEYSYYFRPESEGSYLLPASFWYFSEAKEFFSHSSHEYFHTK